MKKILVVIMIILVNMANAQEHLRFKGAQINGSFDTFVTELEKRGCTSGENVFGNIEGIELVEEWRNGKALIPTEWYQNNTK